MAASSATPSLGPSTKGGHKQMRGSKQDIPVAMEAMGVTIRNLEWGDMNVAIETFPAGMDPAPFFKGLVDDRCQCPHWGYVLKGRMRIRYKDHDEVIQAGDVYYMAPGHLPLMEEDTEVVEFSPLAEHLKTMEVAGRNLEAVLGTHTG
jgi:hypothetical protein